MNDVFIIAEIGINHNGDIEIAKKLVHMAKECGCDAVKFQKRNPEICVPKYLRDTKRETPWGIMPYLSYKERLELTEGEYAEIDWFCNAVGIEWFASAWDLESQKSLQRLNTPYNKIASAMLTYRPLVEMIAEEGKKTFISTGMNEWPQIDRVVELFIKKNCEFVLMHCVSTYPCNDEDCNLRVINTLQDRYRRPVGYSGHEVGLAPSLVAVVLGAVAIERHITLDRSMWGSDQAASLERAGIERLVRDIRNVETQLGTGEKKILPAEMKSMKSLRYWDDTWDNTCEGRV